MSTWADLSQIARGLPESVAGTTYGHPWLVKAPRTLRRAFDEAASQEGGGLGAEKPAPPA